MIRTRLGILSPKCQQSVIEVLQPVTCSGNNSSGSNHTRSSSTLARGDKGSLPIHFACTSAQNMMDDTVRDFTPNSPPKATNYGFHQHRPLAAERNRNQSRNPDQDQRIFHIPSLTASAIQSSDNKHVLPLIRAAHTNFCPRIPARAALDNVPANSCTRAAHQGSPASNAFEAAAKSAFLVAFRRESQDANRPCRVTPNRLGVKRAVSACADLVGAPLIR